MNTFIMKNRKHEIERYLNVKKIPKLGKVILINVLNVFFEFRNSSENQTSNDIIA